MAHFLSDVTHERLQLRANYLEATNPDRVRNYIPGLTHTHDFAATMRCIAVLDRTIEDEKMGPNAVIKSWSGDLDGTISIRHGLDGRVVKKIPLEHLNVFVFALQQYKETMWAGLSNGYLVVYDIASTKKIFEAKAHGGAINRFLLGGDKIFIASADWQISQWNAVDMTRITNGNFSGHTNAVRCIALDGTLLYSGGDDCVIRCWDLTTNTERTGTWPIIAHHDSVRDIVVFDSFLFSSSTDGTINVWNIRTAQLVRQLEVVNASITTLCLDTASNYLWAGSSDGNINIWNAGTLSLVGLLNDHENTNVAAVRQVARVDAIKAWTVCDDGNVRIWYADSNPTDEEYLAVAQMEAELQQHIEDHRNRIIANYEQLEAYKKELSMLEQQSITKKNNLSQLLGQMQSAALERKHLAFAMMWLDKQRGKKWCQEVTGPLMERVNNKALLARYYAGWQAIARERHAIRHKKEVGNYLAEYQKEVSIRAYILKLAKAQQATVDKNQRENLAAALAKTNNAIVADRYYAILKAFVRSRNTSRRMEKLSHCVASQANRGLLEAYWGKLLLASEKARAARIADGVPAIVSRAKTLYDESAEKSEHERVIAIYDARYEALQNRKAQITPYVFKLEEDRDNSLALAAAKAEEDEIKALEEFIAANEGHDEDALDRELMQKQMELIRVTAASGDDLEAQILALQMRNFKLTREHEKDVIVKIDTTLSPLQQVDHAMYLLKANGVSCFHHTARREAARARIATARSAEKIYKGAFDELKKKIAKAVKPIPLQDGDEPEWFAPREYIDGMKRPAKGPSSSATAAKQAKLDAMEEDERAVFMRKEAEKAAKLRAKAIKARNKAILDANDCIVDLCVAYDTLNPKTRNAWVNPIDKQWTNDFQHNNELVVNIEIFNTIALRAYRILRKLDPITGDAKAKKEKKVKKAGKKSGKKATKKGAADGEKKKKKKKKVAKKAKKAATTEKGERKGVKKTAKKVTKGVAKKKKRSAEEGVLVPMAPALADALEEIERQEKSREESPEHAGPSQPTYETPINLDEDEGAPAPLDATAAEQTLVAEEAQPQQEEEEKADQKMEEEVVAAEEEVAAVPQAEEVAAAPQPEEAAAVPQPEEAAAVPQPEEVAAAPQPEEVAAAPQAEEPVAEVAAPEPEEEAVADEAAAKPEEEAVAEEASPQPEEQPAAEEEAAPQEEKAEQKEEESVA